MEHLRPQFGLCSETMTVMCRLWITSKDSEDQFANVEAEAEVLKPAPNDYLQRWPVSKRVNSSKADADDARLVANPGSERNGRGCVGVLTNTFLRSER